VSWSTGAKPSTLNGCTTTSPSRLQSRPSPNSLYNIELLQALSDSEWQRQGNQQRMWPLAVESWLEDNVDHIRNRLMQILNSTGGGQVIADP